MNNKPNEKGYALVLVLLLIVFISIVTAAFMRTSISNAKQENIVDKSNLKVVVAEMGVDYYKTGLSNEYYSRIDELKKFAEDAIEKAKKDNGKNKEVDYVQIRIDTVKKLQGYLINRIENPEDEVDKEKKLKRMIKLPEENIYYKLEDIAVIYSPEKNPGLLQVVGEVEGGYEGDEKTRRLEYTQDFLIPEIDESSVGNGNNTDWANMKVEVFFSPGSVPTKNCAGSEKIEGSSCVAKKQSGIKDIKASDVYANGDFKVHEALDLEKSSVFIDVSLDVKGDLTLVDSKLYIGKDLDVKGDLKVKDYSTLYLGRKFIPFKGELEITENSMVCIGFSDKSKAKDKLKLAKLKIDKSSKLYVFGTLESEETDNEGLLEEVSTKEELYEKCGLTLDVEKWPDPSIDVTYP